MQRGSQVVSAKIEKEFHVARSALTAHSLHSVTQRVAAPP